MRLLVVEDDRGLRESLTAALEDEGYDIVAVSQGEEALAQLASGLEPDAIVMDLVMPVMSGPELLARLKRNPDFAGIPVVVLSGVSEPTLAQTQADAALQKPFDLRDLSRALARVLHT